MRAQKENFTHQFYNQTPSLGLSVFFLSLLPRTTLGKENSTFLFFLSAYLPLAPRSYFRAAFLSFRREILSSLSFVCRERELD